MDSTTLVTFLYQAPRHFSRVEILGSWDNFSKPYPMQRDKSVSPTSWKGCHSFSDIVCDGDLVAMDGSTREGGLQMGGTYWYYYRLDDDAECHDPTVDSTRACPFLPGQEVNVLEVPVQEKSIVCGSTSSLLNVFTLNPAAKFQSPKRSLSPASPIKPTTNRASSLKYSFLSTIPKFSLARSRSTPNRKCLTAPSVAVTTSTKADVRPFSENNAEEFMKERSFLVESALESIRPPTAVPQALHDTFGVLNESRSYPADDLGLGLSYLNLDDNSSIYSRDTSALDEVDNEVLAITHQKMVATSSENPKPRSNRTSGVFSLLSDSIVGSASPTGRHSYIDAHPRTPSLPAFSSFILEPLQLDLPSWSSIADTNTSLLETNEQFGPYLQPIKECSSAITIQPSTTTSLKELNHTAHLSPLEKLDLVESWRNGESPSTVPEAEPSALQDLINDLGYLSSMIA